MTAIDLGTPALRSGTELVPTIGEGETQTGKDFSSDQEVRWCPGCGDYAVLKAVQSFLPDLGLRRENMVFVSGIGCSSRFPYYLDTFGMHSIHGRAPSIATGLATAREDLSVWVVTGDGDALSIGGNHLIHALRRNVNMTILLFNNRIYGLTKGQYSPTSEVGKVTKSTPLGSVDHPFNPVSLALGAEATFVARTIDSDRKHLTAVLAAAAAHRGTSLVEIYQNCPIFNDGAFDAIKDRDTAQHAVIPLEHGKPVTFGVLDETTGLGDKAVVRSASGGVEVVDTTSVAVADIVVHDIHQADPSIAFAISRLTAADYLNRSPIGIFRQVERPAYDDLARGQVAGAQAAVEGTREERLTALINGGDTWTVRGAEGPLDEAVERLATAARTMTPCAPIRDLVEAQDVEAAYQVQQRLTEQRIAEGATVVGRKIGLTSRAVQEQLGVDQPDFGVLFDDMEYAGGDVVRVERLLQPKVEAEIAFMLGADLADGPLDRDQVRAAVSYAVAALEVCDSRVAGWDISFADTVADNASAGVYVLGPQRIRLDEFEPVDVAMTMRIDGEVVSTGSGAACLGDPVEALAWLARTARDLGSPLRAGQLVLSGALGPMAPVAAGQAVTATLEGLGAVTVRFSNEEDR